MTSLRAGSAVAALAILVCAATAAEFAGRAVAASAPQPFLPDIIISSTIPPKGDLNPYGVAIVPAGFPSGGTIIPGDVLVSNFNNKTNAQGTGTTIIDLTPNGLVAPPGKATTFFRGSRLGLTTALGILRRGFVLVGNVPTVGGVIQRPGSLLFLDRNGKEIAPSPYTNRLNGPWDLTIDDRGNHALVFVSNVNNGTVTRLNLAISSTGVAVASATVIASGYTVMPNSAALILGPTGVAYDAATDTLYVASTADNLIFAVSQAGSRTGSSGRGRVAFRDDHLRGPLALVFALNGNLLTANGDAVNADPTQPSEIVEFTKQGKFVTEFNVDAGQGGAFGIGVAEIAPAIERLVWIDDNANDVTVLDRGVDPGY
jgi:DNA-binding beta-propeller fold protein YncE